MTVSVSRGSLVTGMMVSTVSAFRITRTSQLAAHLGHRCPLALWPALPAALVGRDSHDYYGHSVTRRLAARRVIPCSVAEERPRAT